MFAYASALVECGYFDIMEINFLIVGHTHSSIDQYFSVLSKAIDSAEWIGSPISLQALCSQAHKATRGDNDEIIDRRPSINRQIEVYYDVVSALKPYINDQIKFFQVPHHFLFRRVCGKCIMQYKLFPQNPTYLPQEPKEVTTCESLLREKNAIKKVYVSPLSFMNGTDTFFEHASSRGDKALIETFLSKESTNERRYIMWIIEDPKLNLPPVASIRPMLIDSTIGIFDKTLTAHKSADSSSVVISTIKPAPTRSSNGQIDEVVNEGEDGDQEDILAFDSTNDQLVANLRLDRVKGKANPQLARAKMIVNVAKNAMKVMTPSTSYEHFAYTYDDKMVEFNGKGLQFVIIMNSMHS